MYRAVKDARVRSLIKHPRAWACYACSCLRNYFFFFRIDLGARCCIYRYGESGLNSFFFFCRGKFFFFFFLFSCRGRYILIALNVGGPMRNADIPIRLGLMGERFSIVRDEL